MLIIRGHSLRFNVRSEKTIVDNIGKEAMCSCNRFANESFKRRLVWRLRFLVGSLPAWLIVAIGATPFIFVGFSTTAQEINLDSTTPAAKIQLTTRTYYDGAETLGRVGHVAILRRDILHQIKKLANIQYLAEIEKLPEEERDARRSEIKEGILNGYLNSDVVYSQVLDEHIRLLLFYNDYVVSRPRDQVTEQSNQLLSEFNAKVVPELMDQFHCKTVKELEEYYDREIQSDFEQEKRLFVQQQLAILWMQYNLGEEDFTPTLADLKRYYDANVDDYALAPQIKWQGMTVYFGTNRTKEEARKKIVHMGNAVQNVATDEQEKMFAEVCRIDSEDSFAQNGGYRTSTERGSIKSQQVENAVFSDELPVGSMSKIIEEDSYFTIIRVAQREERRIRSFTEVQEEVRKKLVAERTEAMKKKYEKRLSSRFSIEIYSLTQEERETYLRTVNRDDQSATGRKLY